MKSLRLHNISINREFYQNQKKAMIPVVSQSQSVLVSEFFVRCRRTSVLNDNNRLLYWVVQIKVYD